MDYKHKQHHRFSFLNINGIKGPDYAATAQHLSEYMHTNNIDYQGFAETNLNWQRPGLKQQIKSNLGKHTKHSSMQVAHLDIGSTRNYQPGGVLSFINQTVTGRVKNTYNDHLGRWTTTTLHSKRHPISIITAYAPHDQQTGINTIYKQQLAQLTVNGDTATPRAAFYRDLSQHCTHLQVQQHELLILIDANATTSDTTLEYFLTSQNLLSPLEKIHGPTTTASSTYFRGSKIIDHIFCTPTIADYITRAGMSSFDISDHRAIFVDIDLCAYLNLNLPHSPAPKRIISSSNPKHVLAFIQSIEKQLDDKFEALTTTDTVTTDTLNELDLLISNILTTAEASCQYIPDIPWSPYLIRLQKQRAYWRLWQTQLKTNRDTSSQRDRVCLKWNLSHFYNVTPALVTQKLHKLEQDIKLARIEAEAHRQRYLEDKASWYADQEQGDKAAIIKRILNHERRQQAYRHLANILKPSQSSQLTYVLRPEGDTWIAVTDPQEVQQLLVNRNHSHYQQANGTPFTVPPLTTLLGPYSDTEESERILTGTTAVQLSNHMLSQTIGKLNKTTNNISATITTEQLAQGFRRWREATTTSPSGRHLGLYKILSLQRENSDALQRVLDAMTAIINKAIAHNIILDRWKDIECLMLEKLPGNPRIDKLRVIQIFEADLNLVYGILFGRRLVYHADKQGLLSEEQFGSRPKRDAVAVAFLKRLTYENINMDKREAATFDNDAKSCYDRIVINFAMLRCQQLGMPKAVTTHFAQFLLDAHYSVRTAHGKSSATYTHSTQQPLHGPGQGSRAAPALWLFVSTLLIDSFKHVAHQLQFEHPITSDKCTRQFDFYVDDATLWLNNSNNVIADLQDMAQSWEQLLYVSGGKLELSKCFYYIIKWKTNTLGALVIDTSCHTPSITLQDSCTNAVCTITEKSCSTAHRTLGVRLSPTANWKDETAYIQGKTKHFTDMLTTHSCPRYTARLLQKTIYEPTLRYSLAVTSITAKQLRKVQSPSDRKILSKMGYNANCSLAVRYGPTQLGGAGIQCLYNLQGGQQVLLILQHLRDSTPLTRWLSLTFDKFMFVAGLDYDPFQTPDTTDYAYSDCTWCASLIKYLHYASISISLPTLYCVPLRRQNDHAIMTLAIQHGLHLQAINICRLYLKVATLADITDATGTKITMSAQQGTPSFPTFSANWPHQPKPKPKAWGHWKTLLRAISHHNFVLDTALGPWTNLTDYQHQHTYHSDTRLVTDHKTLTTYPVSTEHRRYYTLANPTPTLTNNIGIPVTLLTPQRCTPPSPVAPPPVPAPHWSDIFSNLQTHVPTADTEVIIATDGSLIPDTKQGSFAWIATTATGQLLAQGAGRVNGHPIDSFRCEAYALYAALRYTSLHKLTYTLYTDSQSLIARLKRPKDGLSPHADIMQLIHHQQPNTAQLYHVKSHQADNAAPDADLPLDVRLNKQVDRLATEALALPLLDLHLPSTYITINGVQYTSNERAVVLNARPAADLRQYYSTRWQLPTPPHWEALTIAGNKHVNTVFISKLLTGWLPVASKLHLYNSFHDQACPLCQQDETVLHLFRCAQTTDVYYRRFIAELQKLDLQPEQYNSLHELILQFLDPAQAEPYPIGLGLVPATIPIATAVLAKLILAIWNIAHIMWTERNEIAHRHHNEHLNATIALLYSKRHQLTESEQTMIYPMEELALLQCTDTTKRNWIAMSQPIIRRLVKSSQATDDDTLSQSSSNNN